MKPNYPTRRERVRRRLKKLGADALLVTSFTNVTYLTGFTGDDSYLLLRRDGEVLLTDPRYTEQLEEECPGLEVEARGPHGSMIQLLARVLRSARIGRLAIEAESMTVGLRERIAGKLPRLEMIPTSGLVEEFRQIKDRFEISEIRRAVRYAEKAFLAIRALLRPEMTEKQVSDLLDHQLRLFGAEREGFRTIVGAGPRAALPHAVPGAWPIGEHPILLIDWGATAGIYLSDLTRTLVLGTISPKLRRIYRVVRRAQERAIAAIRPGVSVAKVDKIARGIIRDAGFGRYFGHGLGHGIGLEIHEAPRISSQSQVVFRPGMVVTVEPGIYIPGWGGVRLEDDVHVTRGGHQVLSTLPKDIEAMVVD